MDTVCVVDEIRGSTASEAFQKAVRDARILYGTSSVTGSIADTEQCVEIKTRSIGITHAEAEIFSEEFAKQDGTVFVGPAIDDAMLSKFSQSFTLPDEDGECLKFIQENSEKFVVTSVRYQMSHGDRLIQLEAVPINDIARCKSGVWYAIGCYAKTGGGSSSTW